MAKIMIREIKFRVWDGVDYMSSPFTLNDLQLKAIQFASNCVVMQYTGLKDNNGKEIYEGDIVLCNTKGKIQWPHQGKVEYVGQGDNYYCGYFAINCGKNEDDKDEFTHFWDNENFKVIGNIYENSNEKCSTM